MPRRPLRPCPHPGCHRLVETGRCDIHARQDRQTADRARLSARARGYSSAWEKASKAFIRAHPLCYYCQLQGRITATECVDHATPPRGPDDPLFMDESNWRSACIACNSSKGDDDERAFLARIGIDTTASARG